jgi:hypothetical protein
VISITNQYPLSHPVIGQDHKEVAPEFSGLPGGPIAMAL